MPAFRLLEGDSCLLKNPIYATLAYTRIMLQIFHGSCQDYRTWLGKPRDGGGGWGQAFRVRGVRLSFDALEACEP